MLYVALKFLHLLQLMKWKLNKCRKNLNENDYRNTKKITKTTGSIALQLSGFEIVSDMLLTN